MTEREGGCQADSRPGLRQTGRGRRAQGFGSSFVRAWASRSVRSPWSPALSLLVCVAPHRAPCIPLFCSLLTWPRLSAGIHIHICTCLRDSLLPLPAMLPLSSTHAAGADAHALCAPIAEMVEKTTAVASS